MRKIYKEITLAPRLRKENSKLKGRYRQEREVIFQTFRLLYSLMETLRQTKPPPWGGSGEGT